MSSGRRLVTEAASWMGREIVAVTWNGDDWWEAATFWFADGYAATLSVDAPYADTVTLDFAPAVPSDPEDTKDV